MNLIVGLKILQNSEGKINMLYRRINKPSIEGYRLRIEDIFSNMIDDVKDLDFEKIVELYQIKDLDDESAKGSVPKILNGQCLEGKNPILLEEWGNTNAIVAPNDYCMMSPHLKGCAAVIFYLKDNSNEGDIIVHAYHAAGGAIDTDVLDNILNGGEVEYVIYATPMLKENNHKEVDKLTEDCRIGADKVCMIDGFVDNVYADGKGNIVFN